MGPGIVTGASDDDPSGIGTYAMAGASLGFGCLWTALVTFPLMAAVQFICAKIGLVGGEGIAGILRRHYSKKLLYACVTALIIGNTINAGADLGAIAAAFNLIWPSAPTRYFVVPVGVALLVLQVWGSYRLIASIFKWLTLALFAYIGAAFLARPDWGEVLRGTVLPKIAWTRESMAVLVAILGTTISPYLFFWQANHEVEEEISHGRRLLWQRRGATDRELHYAAWDVNLGMLLSNVVMYFIILATATAVRGHLGRSEIQTASDAAEALRPVAGEAAYLLLAVGLIGAGFLAVPVLTASAGYAVAEAFRWDYGLDKKPGAAKGFYIVIAASTLVALAMNFTSIDPIKALFWTAVINGFLAPPLLAVIMVISNNRRIMGKRVNGLATNVLGWATTAAMFAAAVGLILTWNA